MSHRLQPSSFLGYLNPDRGLPYTPGAPSFSEPTLLMTLALIADGRTRDAGPLVEWALKNRNSDGSIGLNHEFSQEGLWNTSLLAITMHHLGLQTERDSAIDFILSFRSVRLKDSPEIGLDTNLVGWPWVTHTFGWVEPTSWALLSLELAGKSNHPRAVEGRRLLEDRCIPQGGWNYGNKIVFAHPLLPFWDTTALAVLALADTNPELTNANLDLLEKSVLEIRSSYSGAMACLCLARFNRKTEELRDRITIMLAEGNEGSNLAHSALALIALSPKRMLTP